MRIVKILALVIVAASLTLGVGCAKKAPTAEVTKIKEKACACKDAKCLDGFVADLKALTENYNDFEDQEKATTLISEATMCAVKIDPNIATKIQEAVAPK